MNRSVNNKGVGWFLTNSAVAVIMVVITGCNPRNYFLVNSDMWAKYNRIDGQVEFVWKSSIKHLKVNPDSMQVKPVTDSMPITRGYAADSMWVEIPLR